MTKKSFFTLIHGEPIGIAPGTKVLPAEAFSTLMDAQELLAKTREDAIAYKKEIAAECESLKELAQKEGYEAGFQQWAEDLLKLEAEVKSVRAEYAKMLAPVALKATQKIVGKAFELVPDAIFGIVENALKPVLQHKRVTIYVNKEDLDALERNREKLKTVFENIEVLSIRVRDDVTKGGCVIETEGGIINARLENQWAILEKAFESLTHKIVAEEGKRLAKSKDEAETRRDHEK